MVMLTVGEVQMPLRHTKEGPGVSPVQSPGWSEGAGAVEEVVGVDVDTSGGWPMSRVKFKGGW